MLYFGTCAFVGVTFEVAEEYLASQERLCCIDYKMSIKNTIAGLIPHFVSSSKATSSDNIAAERGEFYMEITSSTVPYSRECS